MVTIDSCLCPRYGPLSASGSGTICNVQLVIVQALQTSQGLGKIKEINCMKSLAQFLEQ